MKLHLHKENFVQAIKLTADRMGIENIYIEKDYWVTYALYIIFNNEIGSDTVFKGGTALSKCYNMIDRFSEDIDLVVLRREGESNNKLTTKIRTISEVVTNVLPEIDIPGLTQKMGMNRKTAHSYDKIFTGNYGQVRDVIVVEATWLGYFEPYSTRSVASFVGQMMLDNKQENLAKEYGLLPFELKVLDPTRTLCEKIMSLVRFSYSEAPLMNLKNKIRHMYDLHQLLQQAEFLDFFNSTAFAEMLLKVGNDDVTSFRNNNKWLEYHPKEALVFTDLENIWKELSPIYNNEFKNLVYGNLPADTAILSTLQMIKVRLGLIDWNIKIESKA